MKESIEETIERLFKSQMEYLPIIGIRQLIVLCEAELKERLAGFEKQEPVKPQVQLRIVK